MAEPAIDLASSFTTAAAAAGRPAGQTFNPFADEKSFLLGAFIFEDVGVTAYHGAAPLIQNKTYLSRRAASWRSRPTTPAAIRTVLFSLGLSALRRGRSRRCARPRRASRTTRASSLNGMANLVPTYDNGLIFARSTAQVLNIVYLGGASANNGFFPNGLNGAIA